MWEHKPNMRNTVQRDSQKAFQYAHRHYLPWIYSSKHSLHYGIVAEMWDIHI